jgi:hypothetical protein
MRNPTFCRQRYQILLIAFLAVVLGGCKKSYTLEPYPTSANQLMLKNGVGFLVSKKKYSSVIAANAFHNEKREFVLFLKATSLGASRKNFIPKDHVKAFFIPDSDERTAIPLTVYNGDGYMRLVAKRQASEAAWNAVAQGLAAANAGQSQATSHTNARATYTDSDGYSGSAYGSATTTTTYTDPVARELALQRAERNTGQLAANHSMTFDRLSESILKKTSLHRKESVSGRVYLDDGGKTLWPESGDRLVFRVYVGKERHTFHFRRGSD